MAKTAKTKKKVLKSKTKIATKSKIVIKAPIKISKNYLPKDTEKYMCEKHKVFFRIKLNFKSLKISKANLNT